MRKWITPTGYVYISLYVFLLVFFLLAVRSGDDYGRMMQSAQAGIGGKNFFELNVSYYEITNGRILGNALHLLFVGFPILNAVVRAAISLGIIWSIVKVTGIRYLPAFPVVALLTLVPSVPVLRQAVSWSAGYYNYAVPVLSLLTIVILMRGGRSWLRGAGVALLATASCLFMETVTLALVIVSSGLIVAALIKRKFTPTVGALFAGSILGTVLMFASPTYIVIFSGGDDYRPMPTTDAGMLGSLVGRVAENLPQLSQEFVLDLTPFYLLIALTIILSGNMRGKGTGGWLTTGISLGAVLSLLLIHQVDPSSLGGKVEVVAALGVMALFVVFCLSLVWGLWATKRPVNRQAAAWILGGAAIVMPLLVVAPFGPRNFYVSTVFFLISALLVAAEPINRLTLQPKVGLTLIVLCGLVAAALLGLMAVNKIVEVENQTAAAEQYRQGESVIRLNKFPFPSLVHANADPRKLQWGLPDFVCENKVCTPERNVRVVFE